MTPTASAAARTESSTPASASTTARSWAPIVLPVAVFALAAFAWLYEGRGVTFFIDEWQWIIGRHSPNEASLLQPFHNHLMAVPIAIHQALYRLVGIGSQVPYRVVLLGVHLTCSWLVFTYVRRRIPWQLALAAASVLAFYGYTWTITLWPISLGWAIATAAAVGALLLLDRDARRADAGAAALLVIGIASTSVAVAFVVGIAAEIVLKREWRRIWVVVVPVAVYGAWFLGYGSGTTEPGSLGAVVRFIEKLLAQTTGTLLGVQARGTWAHVTLGVVGAALAVTWYTLGRRTSPRVAGLVVALGSYTVLLALARATSGVTTWYSYPAAVLLLLLVAELLAGRLAASWLTFAVIMVAVWAIAWNLGEMRDAGDFLRGISQREQAELAVTDLVRDRVDPSFKPENYFLRDVTARAYFDVEDRYGSPAFSIAELRRSPRAARRAADGVLVRALKITPRIAGTPPVAAGCENLLGSHSKARTKGGILFVQGATSVSIGMFDDALQPLRSIGSGLATRVDLPVLPGAPQWSLRFETTGSVRLCTLPGSARGGL